MDHIAQIDVKDMRTTCVPKPCSKNQINQTIKIMFYSYGSIYSNAAAAQAQTDATDAQAAAREAKSEVESLRQDIDRLLMITEALWTLLKKQHGYADEVLSDLVKEIDLRDGRLDGKSSSVSPPAPCPSCGKINSAKRSVCIYCGKPLPVQLFAK